MWFSLSHTERSVNTCCNRRHDQISNKMNMSHREIVIISGARLNDKRSVRQQKWKRELLLHKVAVYRSWHLRRQAATVAKSKAKNQYRTSIIIITANRNGFDWFLAEWNAFCKNINFGISIWEEHWIGMTAVSAIVLPMAWFFMSLSIEQIASNVRCKWSKRKNQL